MRTCHSKWMFQCVCMHYQWQLTHQLNLSHKKKVQKGKKKCTDSIVMILCFWFTTLKIAKILTKTENTTTFPAGCQLTLILVETDELGYKLDQVFHSVTHGAVGLSVPLDEEAGAVPDDHPLQMGRHDEPVQNDTCVSINTWLTTITAMSRNRRV